MSNHVETSIAQGNPWYVEEQLAALDSPHQRRVIGRRWTFFDKVIQAQFAASGKDTLKVLDAGCGDGVNLSFLAKIPGLSLEAFDYNPLRVERVQKRFPNIPAQQMDLLQATQTPGRFDVILLSQVLEHIAEDTRALSNLKDMLAPSGTLILGVPNEGCAMARLRNNVLEPQIGKSTDHVQFYTQKSIREKIDSVGLRITDYLHEGFFSPRMAIHSFMNRNAFRFKIMQLLGKVMPSQTAGYYFALTKQG